MQRGFLDIGLDVDAARRGGTPQEVAEAVLWFATCSPFITGQVLFVDGGLSLL